MQVNLPRYESQAALFAARPTRRALLDAKIPAATRAAISINIWRNHAFEPLIPLMEPYCLFGNWSAEFNLGAYDDSFSFSGWKEAALELLWLDSSRFNLDADYDAWLAWLRGQIATLRGISKAPIIVASWVRNDVQGQQMQNLVDSFTAVYFADLQKIAADACVPLLDARTAAMAGSPVSNAAQLMVARELACHWIPALLFPPIKAVALDLDNTLHRGVLGEDGIEGVALTPEHIELQHYAKSLQQRGIFLALVSRNEHADVEALFSKRTDYPLRWEDFSAVDISWGHKADAIARIAKHLRIAPDAVLFVDDNIGELSNVGMELPQTHTIYAHADAGLTCNVLRYYPALWRWRVEDEDSKRIQDLRASSEREALAQAALSPAEYLRSLAVALTYRNNPKEQLTRLADLCNKTNQFNLAMRRFNLTEVDERMQSASACVASVQLSDRLSDSGVIAAIIAEREEDALVVTELCVSCRALGRNLENAIILLALRDMPIFSGCSRVVFRVQHGARNQPALEWLAALLGMNETPAVGDHAIAAARLTEFAAPDGVILTKDSIHG